MKMLFSALQISRWKDLISHLTHTWSNLAPVSPVTLREFKQFYSFLYFVRIDGSENPNS